MKKSKEMKVLSQKITLQIFLALYLQGIIKDTKDILKLQSYREIICSHERCGILRTLLALENVNNVLSL